MDIKDIKELIITIDKTSIAKIEIEKSDIKIMISKNEVGNFPKANLGNAEAAKTLKARDKEMAVEPQTKNISSTENNKSLAKNENIYIIRSPIVGTYYESPSPESPAYAKVGDRVEKGQILCIIEAMKIMNEIECEASGEVIEIIVSNEDIVEYGQPLMKIRRHE